MRGCCRVNAAIGYLSTNPEFQAICAASGGLYVVGGRSTIVLLQAVFKTQDRSAELRSNRFEVDDDVIPLRYTQPEAGDLHRRRQEISIIGNHPEGDHLAQIVWVGEEELVEAGGSIIKNTEPVSPLAD